MKRITRLPGNRVPFCAIAPMLLVVCQMAGAAGAPAVAAPRVQPVPADRAAGAAQTQAHDDGREQAFKLLDQYQATMSHLSSCIFKSKGSCDWSAHYTADMDQSQSGHRIVYESEELRFDGSRYKLCSKRWGPWVPYTYKESNSLYDFLLWDGTNQWAYHDDPALGPGTAQPKRIRSWLSLTDGEHSRKDHGLDVTLGAAVRVGYLLGYSPLGLKRVDVILREAGAISVRGKPEVVGGAACSVIDADTKAGRASIWLDPQRGYLIAKAEYHVRGGDFDGVHLQKPGTVMEFKMTGTRFKKVNETWVTMAGTMEIHKVWLPDGYENYLENYAISEITLNPDFSTMTNAFALEDVREGAQVRVNSARENYVWRSGMILPSATGVYQKSPRPQTELMR